MTATNRIAAIAHAAATIGPQVERRTDPTGLRRRNASAARRRNHPRRGLCDRSLAAHRSCCRCCQQAFLETGGDGHIAKGSGHRALGLLSPIEPAADFVVPGDCVAQGSQLRELQVLAARPAGIQHFT